MELVLLNGCKSKRILRKNLDTSKIMTNLKNIFYVDKEMLDIMRKFYQIKRNLIISILFLIQRNCILSRLSSVQKAFDIGHKGSHPHPTPTSQRNHKNTNHRV